MAGEPSIVPATRAIHHKLVIANYFSVGAIDTDGGSVCTDVYANFLACGEHGPEERLRGARPRPGMTRQCDGLLRR